MKKLCDMRKFFTMLSDYLKGYYNEDKIVEICNLLPFSQERRDELAVEYLLFRIRRNNNA